MTSSADEKARRGLKELTREINVVREMVWQLQTAIVGASAMLNVNDRPRTADHDDEPAVPVECSCGAVFDHLDQAHHDWLLSFEDRGVAGVMEIVNFFEGEADCYPTPGNLEWQELPDFVARHNWRNPLAVAELANYVGRAITSRLEYQRRMLEGVATGPSGVAMTAKKSPTSDGWARESLVRVARLEETLQCISSGLADLRHELVAGLHDDPIERPVPGESPASCSAT
jgi:hypothetical protein